ncbi:hypothetical protein ACIHCQ_06590 [Streptomyces sp. NPDC052236]|uniref:hypothetical protein n=1 Tax=Streptomyces sp. NPDC052236 TaxID=3365686 RepID=UPI0037D220CB
MKDAMNDMGGDKGDGMSGAKELLGRAVADVGRSTVSADAVYAKAAKVRWRRRAVMSGAALALVAAGAVSVPVLAAQDNNTTSVAAPPRLAEDKGDQAKARQLAKLLPAEVGTIERVRWDVLIKMANPKKGEPKYVGPLDGQYAISRDGGVGYLSMEIKDQKYIDGKTGGKGMADDLCAPDPQAGVRLDCVREKLPDGRVLTIWRKPVANTSGEPRWGAELTAQLTLKGGQVLLSRDITGFAGKGELGPLLKTPPLTRAQFRELLLRPELLPAEYTK